jgi:hypothetical protein
VYGLRDMRAVIVSCSMSGALLLGAARARAQPPGDTPTATPPGAVPVAPEAPVVPVGPQPMDIPPQPNVPSGKAAPVPPASPPGPDQGISVGLRAGWAFPMGALKKGESLRSNFSGMIPVWLDAGYRISRQFYLGAYFQWAAVFVSDEVCPKNLSCSANDLRFGINVHWHFKWLIHEGKWAGRFDPWVGIGTGYETAVAHLSVPSGASSSETNHGFEYGNLQLGGDFVASPMRIGLFTTFSLAQYLRRTHTVPTGSPSYSIPDPAVHFWLMFGLRGQYDF